MARKKANERHDVCIVESLDFLQRILSKKEKYLSDTAPVGEARHYTYLRSSDEMKAFVRSSGGRNIDISRVVPR